MSQPPRETPRRQPRRPRRLHSPDALESYLRGAILPRFIERLREIEDAVAAHRGRLAAAHAQLAAECAGDAELFARRWRATAKRWSFDAVNALIEQHNEYYPIERDLPMDPRTGEYVKIRGRSYRREPLDAHWVLERFPPLLPPRK